jgi:hypothetical protein
VLKLVSSAVAIELARGGQGELAGWQGREPVRAGPRFPGRDQGW